MSSKDNNHAYIQLAATKGDIFAVGRDRKVDMIMIHNTNSSAEQVVILFHDGTNEYQILDREIAVDETYTMEFPKGLYIPQVGKLTGNADTAEKVTCLVVGTIEL